MGNFDFVKTEWPQIHQDAARAESYLHSDTRSACFYTRRTVELLVHHLYDLKQLPEPYRNDLAARIHDQSFTGLAPSMIIKKLDYLRELGNAAVHDPRPLKPAAAQAALSELFHVLIWAAYSNFVRPDVVPTLRRFDPSLAPQAAPLSHHEVIALNKKFEEQDKAHRKELAASQEKVAALEAELERARAQIAAGQAAKTAPDDHDYQEEETRDRFIDLLLNEAGWELKDERDREYPVTGMPTKSGKGRVDYVLWGSDGRPLGLVEAKRTSSSTELGREQAGHYADALEREFGRRPIIFMSNGQEHTLWDDAAGYPPRTVSGFYTAEELELLLWRRENRKGLEHAPISTDIAGRAYQQKAIRAVDDAFARSRRHALLVMATGTGKTRTVIALVEQLMKTNWAKRVLFLADRTSLVRQAVDNFKTLLPQVTTVNLVEEKNTEGRIFASTYPTMLNLIQEMEGGRRRFGPGYFDVVVVDEAHRSVYAKYGYIFEYFDALLVGLTATPKDEVDHNTYHLFELEDGVPTDAYGLDEAIEAGWLVPPRSIAVGSTFLRRGIKYEDLTEEQRDEWDALEWNSDGEIPTEIRPEEINRFLFNQDTVDKVLTLLMEHGHKVEDGERLGKSIVFAKSQKHAEFILRRFDALWPEYGGQFAQIITHESYQADELIKKFSQPASAPHLAISVDMLDTGIDVPDVVNLVLFKTVHSRTKFWQMIGRGTRLRPDLYGPGKNKQDFLVFDFCGNLEYFSENLDAGREGSTPRSLGHRIFDRRVALLGALNRSGAFTDLRDQTAQTLHRVVAGMTLENPLVRKHRFLVEKYSDPEAWSQLTPEGAQELDDLGGLPTSVQDSDTDAKRFDLLMLNGQLAQLEEDSKTLGKVRENVQQLAEQLLAQAGNVPKVKEQAVLLEAVAGERWWQDVTLPMLEQARTKLRELVRLIEHTRRNPVYTNFRDTIDGIAEIDLPQVTPGVNMRRFKEKAQAYLREHEDQVALQKLRRNKQLTETDLAALEQLLEEAGGGPAEIQRAKENHEGNLGLFIRGLVGMDPAEVQEAFSQFLDENRHSVDQIRFMRMLMDEVTERGVVDPGRLFEDPYTDVASGPDLLFPEQELDGIVTVLQDYRRKTIPERVA